MVVLNQGQVVADGAPGMVLTKGLLADVFKVQANIVTDPDSGSPVCLPYRTAVPVPHSNGVNGHK